MDTQEPMLGNYFNRTNIGLIELEREDLVNIIRGDTDYTDIALTENEILKLGYSVVSENSVGKQYTYVVDGVYSGALCFIYWKKGKRVGNFCA